MPRKIQFGPHVIFGITLVLVFAQMLPMAIFTKAEWPQEGILFCTQFPSLVIFIKKKVGFRKKLRPPNIKLLKLT